MRRYEFFVLILVSLTVFSAGCVKNGGAPVLGKLLEVTLDAPESVFMGENFSVYLDINNLGNKTYKAVNASFFDTDGFEKLSPCKATWNIKKKEIKILECKLRYPISNIEKSTIRNIYASVSYDGYLNSAAQLIVLSEKEYRLREKTNSLPSITNLFTKRNDELEAIVRFKDNPFIIKPAEKQTYMYITIKNVGDGYIDKIDVDKLKISLSYGGHTIQVNPRRDCGLNDTNYLYINGDTFPQITCKIGPFPTDTNYLNIIAIINLWYRYDLRRSAQIKIEV